MPHRRPARAAAGAILALALPVLALPAQGFRYAPGTATYDASVVTKVSREMGGQRMDDSLTQRQRLTVSVEAGGRDTLRLGVRIDTASVTSLGGPQNVEQLIGLEVQAAISPVGHVYSSRLVRDNLGPAGPMLAAELAKILPRVRPDLRVGLAWTDTIVERVEMLGLPIERRTIVTSRVAGDTTVAGQPGWRVDRSSVVRFTGDGTIQAERITLTGESKEEGHLVVARSGRFLGSRQRDSSVTTFSASGTSFSIRQEQTTSVQSR